MKYISRAQWGAAPAKSSTTLRKTSVKGIGVHYSGMLADWLPDHEGCAQRVQSIQRFHQHGRGWADIAYSWIVCRHGAIFEGRGWGKRTAANGTNAGNDAFHAVCFLGGDKVGRKDLTARGRVALKRVCAASMRRYGHSTSGVVPHRKFKATACPGDEIAGWLEAGMPARSASPAPVQPTPPSPSPEPNVDEKKDGVKVKQPIQVTVRKRLLKLREKGREVKQLQRLIGATSDGVFGPRTRSAVKKFQKRHGLDVDGIVGEETWKELLR